MAEIVSALSTAAAALQLGKMAVQMGSYLWKLGKAIKKVEQTLSNLAAEADALAQACELINQEIKVVVTAPGDSTTTQYDGHGYLWKSVTLQLLDTQATVDELQHIVGADIQKGKDFFQRARKQIHLDRNKDELEVIRRRLHTHTQSLQMALQMVNIKVAYLAPKIASDDLAAKIEELKKGVQDLQLDYRANGHKNISPSEVELIRCAKDIMRSGKSLCEESLAGDYMQGRESASRINRVVAEWAGDVESLRRDAERSRFLETETHAPTIFSDDSALSINTGRATTLDEDDNEQSRKGVEGSGDDLDDDFVLEIAQAALGQGQEAFAHKDWSAAETLLKVALMDLASLPPRRRAGVDIFELQYKLTFCAYHTREPAVAKKALTSLVGQTPVSDRQKGRIYVAAHLLAQLHLRDNELEAARIICESNLKGRSKLFGKTHDSYLESLALMAQVHFLQGNAPRARILMGMIPGSPRSALHESLHSLPTQLAIMGVSDLNTSGTIEASRLHTLEKNQSNGVLGRLQSPSIERSISETTTISKHDSCSSPKMDICEAAPFTNNLHEVSGTPTGKPKFGTPAAEDASNYRLPVVTARGGSRESQSPSTMDKASRQKFIDQGGRSPQRRLETAICECELALALALVVTATEEMRSSNPGALHYAVHFGDFDIASALIKHGWDVNGSMSFWRDCFPLPVLFEAMGMRRPTLVQLLLENGASLALKKPSGSWSYPVFGVLSSAELARCPATEPSAIISCIAQALAAGWSVDREVADGSDAGTLLSQAVSCRPMQPQIRCAVVKFLLDKGAFRRQKYGGLEMLHHAVISDCPEVIPLLLKQDTERQLRNKCGDPPADALCRAVCLAAMKGGIRTLCAEALLQSGAQVHIDNQVPNWCLPESLRRRSDLKKFRRSAPPTCVTVTPFEVAMASESADLKRMFSQYNKS